MVRRAKATLFVVFLGLTSGNHVISRGQVDFDYRIADTVKALYGGPYSKMRVKMPAKFPGSIAADYVNASSSICGDNGPGNRPEALLRRQVCYDNKVAALDAVLERHCPRPLDLFRFATVVHLRLGDSFCATTVYAATALRPPPVAEVVSAVSAMHVGGEPCTIVYSSHGGCENETRAYVTATVAGLGGDVSLEEGVGWRDADRHLCAMANARLFVQGAGGFSYLAGRVRARRGLRTDDSLVRTPMVWLDARLELKKKEEDDLAKAAAKQARIDATAARANSTDGAGPVAVASPLAEGSGCGHERGHHHRVQHEGGLASEAPAGEPVAVRIARLHLNAQTDAQARAPGNASEGQAQGHARQGHARKRRPPHPSPPAVS